MDPDDLTALEHTWSRLLPPQWLDSARAVYENLPFQRYRQLPLVDVPYDHRRLEHWADAARVADFASLLPPGGRTVIDIGPGDGWPSIPLALGFSRGQPTAPPLVVGIEPSPRRSQVCRANARRLAVENARFVTADAVRLPLAERSVDLAVASYSLEECPAPPLAMREIRRVLRPGGVLRVASQRWQLAAPEVESVALLEGAGGTLLLQYARRTQSPARERRYTLVVPGSGPAAEIHTRAVLAAADEPRVFGETRLGDGSPLGIPLLAELAPHAIASVATELRRWTTEDLCTELQEAGFNRVRATEHSGERGRAAGREWLASGISLDPGEFEALTREVGERAARGAAGRATGGMVTAYR